MTLKIIGGKFKGRMIKTPKGSKTRPTSAILRKAVFDICQGEIADSHFLDLFAGSGAMGIEAVSRGASQAVFVDNDKNAQHCIMENITLLQIPSYCRLLKGDAMAMLQKLEKEEMSFDLIYVDPPYGANLKDTRLLLASQVLEFLSKSSLLSPNGTLFIEEAKEKEASSLMPIAPLALIDSRSFGKSLLHQYRKFL